MIINLSGIQLGSLYPLGSPLHISLPSFDPVLDHAGHAQEGGALAGGFYAAAPRDNERTVSERVAQLTETLLARKSVDLARIFGFFSYVAIPVGYEDADQIRGSGMML